MNIVSKIYESVLKIQNEHNNEKISPMQTAERKRRSTIDNLIILNSAIGNQRENQNKTCLFFAEG